MEKIVTHPLYIRCKKVIESCQNREQHQMALTYTKLAFEKMKGSCKSNNFMDAFTYHCELQSHFNSIIIKSKYCGVFDDI